MEKSLNGRTLVWAHRGCAYAPENTLPSFKMAAEMGADGIELDVHLSKDGQIIVCHNDTINDTCNGKGKIREMTLAEIRQFNFAFRYNNTELEEKFGFVPAPTLDEVYDLLAPTGLTVNVELKGAEDELLRRCAAVAKNAGMEEKVYYSSFNHNSLMRMLDVDSKAATAPLYGGALLARVWDYAQLIGAKAIHPGQWFVFADPTVIKSCHDNGIRVNPWTVDVEDSMRQLTEMGADALITDLPDVARKVVDEVLK